MSDAAVLVVVCALIYLAVDVSWALLFRWPREREARDEAYIDGFRFGLKASGHTQRLLAQIGAPRGEIQLTKGSASTNETVYRVGVEPLPLAMSEHPIVVERYDSHDGTKFPELQWTRKS